MALAEADARRLGNTSTETRQVNTGKGSTDENVDKKSQLRFDGFDCVVTPNK